jgi:uncharacterized Zn finger protein
MANIKKHSKPEQKSSDKLTEKTIEQHVGERNIRLGQDYAADGSLFRCQRQGELLKACCRGRSADHYVLSAGLKEGQIVDAECSCPVGGDGRCKHIAALLLAAMNSPEEFLKTEPLEKRLAACDKPELIQLIVQIVEQDPDLEPWLELALPAKSGPKSKTTVKSDAYRRQTKAAFSSAGYGWEADRQLTAALTSLQKIGDGFLKQKNPVSAAAVYCGILEGFLGEYESFQDETGNVTGVAQECIVSLGTCLPELAESSKERQAALRTLFDVLRLDIDCGGIGLSDEVPEILSKQATAAERSSIAAWIRKETPAGDDFSSKWGREAWGGLLLDLEGEPEDDEAFLRHCREFGLTGALVERLLQRGRLDDALQEIRSSSDYDMMGHADQLVAHKHSDLAHKLIRERLASDKPGRNDSQLRDWLKRFYRSRNDWPPLLQLLVEDFRRQPSLAVYQEIRKLAQELKQWESLRPELLAGVPRDSTELIRIHLDEGNVGEAIPLFESRSRQSLAVGWARVDLEIAKAAETSHPETALKIHRAEAERLIAGRGREQYKAACESLKHVLRLFKALGRQEDWTTYLATLRNQHRSLRAFQEELTRAGL